MCHVVCTCAHNIMTNDVVAASHEHTEILWSRVTQVHSAITRMVSKGLKDRNIGHKLLESTN